MILNAIPKKDNVFLNNPKKYRRNQRLSPINASCSKENASSWVLMG